MPPPTNTTAATAINIVSLPFDTTQNAHDAGTTYDLWYKYTAVDGDFMIGVWGFGGTINVGYQPLNYVYGPNDPLDELLSSGANKPLQFLSVVGSTYYFRFRTNNVTVTPANITISILRGPNETVIPQGSILIPDDSPSFPLSILSLVDAQPLTWKTPFPAGESVAVLNDGSFIVEDAASPFLPKIYNPDLSLRIIVAGVPWPSFAGLTSDRIDTFYLCHTNTSPAQIWKIMSDGTVIGNIAQISKVGGGASGIGSIAISPDESILYYAEYPGSESDKIKRHNLLTNTPLSDLTSGVAGYFKGNRETLCLKDGTIISACQNGPGGRTDYVLKRYNPNGSVANTYTSPGALVIDTPIRMAYALDDPNSFWVWFETWSVADARVDGGSTFINIKVSDGSILKNITGYQYEVGSYGGVQTATPVRFGHSESCPFFILGVAIDNGDGNGDVIPGAGIYELVPGKRNDTIYTEDGQEDVKIPNPRASTTYIGS